MKNTMILILLFFCFANAQESKTKASINNPNISTPENIAAKEKICLEELYEKAQDNIRQTDRILNLMEIFVGFVGFVIAAIGIVGGVILKNVSKTKNRLDRDLKRLTKQWGNIQNEHKESKKLIQAEMADFRQILFFVTEGDNSIDAGRYDEAVSYFKQALKIKKDEPEIIAKVCHTFIKGGKYDDAIFNYHEGLKHCPNNINLLNGLARAYRKNNNFKKAEIYYTKALERDNNFIWALSGLGQVLLYQKQFDEALEIFHKLLRLEDFYMTHINLGILYYCTGCPSLSENHFERALHLIELGFGKRDNKWIKFCKFLALVGLNKNEEAWIIGKRLKKISLTPSNIQSIKFRLNILFENTKEKRFEEFLVFISKIMENN